MHKLILCLLTAPLALSCAAQTGFFSSLNFFGGNNYTYSYSSESESKKSVRYESHTSASNGQYSTTSNYQESSSSASNTSERFESSSGSTTTAPSQQPEPRTIPTATEQDVPIAETPPEISFTTSCELKDGKANGYIHNEKDGFVIDGDMWFYFYDCDGNLISKNRESDFEWVLENSTEKVEDAKAPEEACSCEFDVSSAHIEVE